MQAPDYFSLEYLHAHIPSTLPVLEVRSQSTWPRLRTFPSSFLNWTYLANRPTSTPPGSLKASILCKGSGLSPDYDPPASEWVYLGAQQPVFAGKPREVRRKRGSGLSSISSSSSCESVEEMEVLVFGKREVKRGSGESVLSQGIKEKGVEDKKKWLVGVTIEQLPSAFEDSDDEDN